MTTNSFLVSKSLKNVITGNTAGVKVYVPAISAWEISQKKVFTVWKEYPYMFRPSL